MKITTEISDETLVYQSLSGDRTAFEEIVRRYQLLVCSVAYSSTGNVTQSEDVAQETLVTAWLQLRDLREPAKLKSWLCGIARNLAHNSFRRETRHTTESFDMLDAASEPAAAGEGPAEATLRSDDEALAWRALESVPEIYRETLVLYYRQHQSIEHVAVALDVTEETVRQRLSRGRKVLQEQVLSLLGATLTRTVPAVAFTASVMSALPMATLPAAAAGAAPLSAGGLAAKGGGVAKAASLTLLGGAALSAIFGAIGLAVGNRLAVEMTDSPRERAYMRQRGRKLWVFTGALLGGLGGIFVALRFVSDALLPTVAISSMVFVAAWALTMFLYANQTARRQSQIRKEEASLRVAATSRQPRRYVSAAKFLGLPLVAIDLTGTQGTVRGWIAIGHVAQGGLLAVGQLAIAPIAAGACAIGVVSFGALGMGLISFSALAVGWWAAGGFAYGYDSIAGVAIASHFAGGGLAWSSQFALGARAMAPHANDAEAFRMMTTHLLFRYNSLFPWAGAVLALAGLVPNWLMLKKRLKQKSSVPPARV